jgi:hypothetical protein
MPESLIFSILKKKKKKKKSDKNETFEFFKRKKDENEVPFLETFESAILVKVWIN